MKKWIAILLVLTLVVCLAAGCGKPADTKEQSLSEKTPQATVTEVPIVLPESSLDLLTTVWQGYGTHERFDAVGGSVAEMVTGMPGVYTYENAAELEHAFWIPTARSESVVEAASLMHGLNRNTFTCGAFRLAPDTDAIVFAAAWAGNMKNADWVCGFPEQILAVALEETYVVCIFGTKQLVSTFETKLAEAYPYARTVYTGALKK